MYEEELTLASLLSSHCDAFGKKFLPGKSCVRGEQSPVVKSDLFRFDGQLLGPDSSEIKLQSL